MACRKCGGNVDALGNCLKIECGGIDQLAADHKKARAESSCWVATAYYSDPFHRDVNRLREIRRALMSNYYFGWIIVKINNAYHFIGGTKFGKWWALRASRENNNLVRKVSGSAIKLALSLSKTSNSGK